MTLSVTHSFTSAIADDPTAAAAGEVLPSHWNAAHAITGGTQGSIPFFGAGSVLTQDNAAISWDDTNKILSLGAGLIAAAEAFRVYNVNDGAGNYERGIFDWNFTSNVLTIGTQAGGTGVARNMQFVIGGTNVLDYGVSSPGNWTIVAGNLLIAGGVGTAAGCGVNSNAFYGGRSAANTAALIINAAGANYGQIGVTASQTWALGTGSVGLTISSVALSWDASGPVHMVNGAANGQSFDFQALTELTTIAAAATTTTVIQIPANSVVLGVSVRVTTVIPTAATFTVTAGGKTFNTAAVSSAANSTDPGTAAGPVYFASATAITITPNLTPGANTGRVRTTIHYYTITPPTS